MLEAWFFTALSSVLNSWLLFQVAKLVKSPPANAGDTRDMDSIPGSGRSPGVGNGNPFQYSCLGNPMDRGAWRATAYGVTKEPDMTECACTQASPPRTVDAVSTQNIPNELNEGI